MGISTQQRPSPPQTPLACSITSFARLIDVSPATVEREVRDGRVRSIRVRGRRLIPFDEARDYLRRLLGEENG